MKTEHAPRAIEVLIGHREREAYTMIGLVVQSTSSIIILHDMHHLNLLKIVNKNNYIFLN